MNRVQSKLPGACVALVAMTLAGPAAAQDDYRAAQNAVDAALKAGESGAWQEGAERLLESRNTCDRGNAGDPCRLLIDFNLGYAWEQYSRSEPEAGTKELFLNRSAESYLRVLEDAPEHAATLHNLSLVLAELGEVGQLRDVLDVAEQGAQPEAAEIAVLLGDVESRQSEWAAAYGAYARAAAMAPQDATAPRRMVDLFADLPPDEADDLWSRLDGWEAPFPGVAREGYRTAIQRHADSDPERAEAALLRWVALSAAERNLSGATMERAFVGIDWEPLSQFRAYMAILEEPGEPLTDRDAVRRFIEDHSAGYESYGWWLEWEQRRQALAQASLALGHESILAKSPVQAERRWLIGLRDGPGAEAYVIGELRNQPFVRLDLLTELTWLQYRFPEIGADGGKAELFIALLFEGKAAAYQANDLEAIQRHHTVLGELFAARGVWTSDSFAANAIFQLSNAISIAERRDAEEGTRQPLPRLKELLAMGYAETGATDRASDTARAAADAYAEIGNLDKAEEVEAWVRTVGPR